MGAISDITTRCKSGQVQQAYDIAKADMEKGLPWAQREMGWVLYYLIKGDTETGNFSLFVSHLEELKLLDQLSIPYDNMIFENVLFKVGMFLKNDINPDDPDTPDKLSAVFSILRSYNFGKSKGYSFLLTEFIKYKEWPELVDFLDWWNLDKLTDEDYLPFKNAKGNSIMSLAERAYIAKSKALLKLKDRERINDFLPQMDKLMANHPEMTYLGYYYGKLLLELGGTIEEELRVVIPFVRKKSTEFWVWQLLAEVFTDNPDTCMACLLRAVHCHAQEMFLVNVRTSLAKLYIERGQYDFAKYQIDQVVQTRLSHNWRISNQIESWTHEPWFNTVTPNDTAPMDFMSVTDSLLCEGTEEAIAVVTYADTKTHRSVLVYGKEKYMSQKLTVKVQQGTVLKINYVNQADGRSQIIRAQKTRLVEELDFVKTVEGNIVKREDKEYAFLKTKAKDYFIAPNVVKKFELQNHDMVRAMVVWNYNKKKEIWDWTCVNIKKNIQ